MHCYALLCSYWGYASLCHHITVVTLVSIYVYVASAGRNKQPPQQSYLTLAYDIDVNGIAAYIQLG